MKTYARWFSALRATIILTACVAIPENPPPTPAPRPERDVSELASALAKLYLVDGADGIHDRLTELEKCILHEMVGETRLTPEEFDVVASCVPMPGETGAGERS